MKDLQVINNFLIKKFENYVMRDKDEIELRYE